MGEKHEEVVNKWVVSSVGTSATTPGLKKWRTKPISMKT